MVGASVSVVEPESEELDVVGVADCEAEPGDEEFPWLQPASRKSSPAAAMGAYLRIIMTRQTGGDHNGRGRRSFNIPAS